MDDDLPQHNTVNINILRRLATEDLDPLSVAELDGRIEALEAELERTRRKRAAAATFRAQADSLFGKKQ